MGRTGDQTPEEGGEKSLQQRVGRCGREVWLAGLGALAATETEGDRLFETLVERGQKFERQTQSFSGTVPQRHVPVRTLQSPEREGSVSRQKIEQSICAVHVSVEDGEWIVRKTGADRVRRSFSSEDEALSFATSVASKHDVGLFAHDEHGTVTQVGVN